MGAPSKPILGKYLGYSIWSRSFYVCIPSSLILVTPCWHVYEHVMETINSHLQATSPRPISPLSPFSHHLLGLLPNCMLRYLHPLSVKFTSTLPQANQCLVAGLQSPLQPRTDETYKVKTWAGLFSQQAKSPWFFFPVSLTHYSLCS